MRHLLASVIFLPTLTVWSTTSCGGPPAGWQPLQSGTPLANNVTELLNVAEKTMSAAFNAILSTHALTSGQSAGSPADINSRVMSPKPVARVSDTSSLSVIYIDTNNLSRKFTEVQEAVSKHGAARANLMYYDRDNAGYVALRGNLTIASSAEASKQWWDGWAPFYPQGASSPTYSLLIFKPDLLELSVAGVSSGRADWLPVALERVENMWHVAVPAAPPAPAPTPAPLPSNWRCSVCAHVYDPQKDGHGVAFEDLPDTFKCPVCGQPKSAFKKITLIDGTQQWSYEVV